MSSLNKVMIIGNLGQDPEVRYTQGGTAVVNFSVATSERWTDKQTGEVNENTEWHRIVAWAKLAELCGQYLEKGRKVYIEGQLQTRSYEKDGITRYSTEIKANDVQFLDSTGTRSEPSEDDAPKPKLVNAAKAPKPEPISEEEMPF